MVCVFDITLKLNWEATRLRVKKRCVDIDNTGTVVLEIDGITLDIHPHSHKRHLYNYISDFILLSTTLQQVTLLNYSRPQEQCIHFRRCSIQSPLSPTCFLPEWVELKSDLKFSELVAVSKVATDGNKAMKELGLALEKAWILRCHHGHHQQ